MRWGFWMGLWDGRGGLHDARQDSLPSFKITMMVVFETEAISPRALVSFLVSSSSCRSV